MFPVEARQESALSDAVLLSKLYKRVAYGLVPRADPAGARVFLHGFLTADRRCVASQDAAVPAPAVVAAVSSVFPVAVLKRQDVPLLLHVLPLEESDDGGVKLGDVLLALRELTPFHTWQVAEAVGLVRAAVGASAVMSTFEEHVRDLLDYTANRQRQQTEPPPPPLTTREALFFLDRVGRLSSSQSQLLLRYVAREENDADDTAVALCCDVRLLHGLLFTDEMPAVAEYPLLMGRLAEACCDGGDATPPRPTGSLAIHAALAGMSLTYPPAAQATPEDFDFGSLVRAELTPRQFFYLCKTMQVGFTQRESDQLFYYLKQEHHSSEGVRVVDLVAAFRQYFPPVTMSALQLVQAATASWVRRGGGGTLAFVQLYAALRPWGTARVPLTAFVAAFRDAGVPDGLAGVLDVELEWLRLKAPTRVDVLLMLCSPVPPSRTAVIQKLFERLDTAAEGRVDGAAYVQRCQPERVEAASLRRQVALWKPALAAYVEELREPTLTYELFVYFWYMVSAGIEDDPTFTVAVWQVFGLADDGRRPRRR